MTVATVQSVGHSLNLDVYRCGFSDGTVRQVSALDVMEHSGRDAPFVRVLDAWHAVADRFVIDWESSTLEGELA
jgi:hypothetical protein